MPYGKSKITENLVDTFEVANGRSNIGPDGFFQHELNSGIFGHESKPAKVRLPLLVRSRLFINAMVHIGNRLPEGLETTQRLVPLKQTFDRNDGVVCPELRR